MWGIFSFMKAKKLLFEEIACFLALIFNHAFAVMDFFRTWPGVSQSINTFYHLSAGYATPHSLRSLSSSRMTANVSL